MPFALPFFGGNFEEWKVWGKAISNRSCASKFPSSLVFQKIFLKNYIFI